MVNFNTLKDNKPIYNANIDSVYEQTLRAYLKTPEKIKAMKEGMRSIPSYLVTREAIDEFKEKRLDETVLVIVYTINIGGNLKTVSEWYTIPVGSYRHSLIYLIQQYQQLPIDTKDWKDKTVTVHVADNGYFRIIH